ncbi:MAG TPA: hypothetical protein PKD64_17885 [Pirellulaceae bacterium]|nr:hypothetical protein [Pirellulaceae bacterium]HMO94060.1 hypothetical protein [Pirellulaceae bacterium]HMP70934.1 hypothetical protein [Pirellulaceae bacterium]
MLNCKETTKLISDSLDRKLTFRERMGLWLHMMMCSLCRRFRSNIIALRRRLRAIIDPQKLVDANTPAMSEAARARLEAAIKQRMDDSV